MAQITAERKKVIAEVTDRYQGEWIGEQAARVTTTKSQVYHLDWLASISTATCDCPAGAYGHRCKHIISAMQQRSRQRRTGYTIAPRPLPNQIDGLSID